MKFFCFLSLRRVSAFGGTLLLLLAGVQAAVRPPEVPNFNLLDLANHNHELRRAEGRALARFAGRAIPSASTWT